MITSFPALETTYHQLHTLIENALSPCREHRFDHAGLLQRAYLQADDRTGLVRPYDYVVFMPDDQYQYQTFHVLNEARPVNSRQESGFGSISNEEYSLSGALILIAFNSTLDFKKLIRAVVESGLRPGTVEFDTLNVLRRYAGITPDSNTNFNTNLSAWAINYSFNNLYV